MKQKKMAVVPAKLTEKLVIEIEAIIKDGWYSNKSEFIRDAVREMIKKLKAERLASAIKEDVAWGLYGR
jgi:Arc/MetJ-type ribon-helix-helix transcriptional regulator